MKFRKKKLKNLILSFTLIMGILAPFFSVNTAFAAEKKIDVMFISDTHSHLEPFNTTFEGKSENMGGFARLKTLINDQKAKNPETLIIDGGDFSMGTMYQTLFETEASELRMLGNIGVDFTTMGNHEFDFGSDGLADMVNSAVSSGENLPSMVLCNVDWDESIKNDGAKQIKDAFDRLGVEPYKVIEKDGVKIAVIGVFGKDALNCAPSCELKFLDPVEAVKKTVQDIQTNEQVDIIILLSHSGLGNDSAFDGNSEDEIMAKSVPQLNLILSGHSHTTVKEPLLYGKTYIVGCGEYTEQIGNLSMIQNEKGDWVMTDYSLLATRKDVAEDEKTKEKIKEFSDLIDSEYLSNFGYTRNQVLATNDIAFESLEDIYNNHTESRLGNYISDAFRIEAGNALGEEIDIAFIPAGCIRETIPVGDVTVESVFDICSLGIGQDRIAGYPLVKGYVSGKDIKLFIEIDASISEYMQIARFYISGLGYSYNPHRLILDRANDFWIIKDGQREELEDDKLYSVVTDSYTFDMISVIEDVSKNLLSISIKDENGNIITDFDSIVIHENDKSELKAWEAVAHYTESFEDNHIPQKYAELEGRKIVDDTFTLSSITKNVNELAKTLIFITVVLAVAIILILVHIVILIQKKSKK